MVNCKHPDCYYRNVDGDYCEYCILMSRRRPRPAGDCVGVYKPKGGTKVVLGQLTPSRGGTRTFDADRAMELYIEGKSDAEISRELGVSYKAIRNWRKYEGLPSTKNMKGDAEWT